MAIDDLSESELDRLYGAWTSRTPRDVATLFEGYPGVWWIAGGWAIEAFTGTRREHRDIDPNVLRDELHVLRRHLAGRFDLWSASSGALRPVHPNDQPDAPADAVLLPGCSQVWLRKSSDDAWEYDVLLSPGSRDEWVYRREPALRLPLNEALWEQEGVRYLQPEIQLLYKAKARRPKDDADFRAALPLLDERRKAWLREALLATLPATDHPWIGALDPSKRGSAWIP
ncbi:MAG TPA: hypothetical protein VHM25_14615 [Polyangiaceae bacterium]|nr:hypothetical protein [Polyangiaceae bacterium]